LVRSDPKALLTVSSFLLCVSGTSLLASAAGLSDSPHEVNAAITAINKRFFMLNYLFKSK
jgi:hypothetical protein